MARAASDVDDAQRGGREVREQVLMDDVGPHASSERVVVRVDVGLSEFGPGVVVLGVTHGAIFAQRRAGEWSDLRSWGDASGTASEETKPGRSRSASLRMHRRLLGEKGGHTLRAHCGHVRDM